MTDLSHMAIDKVYKGNGGSSNKKDDHKKLK